MTKKKLNKKSAVELAEDFKKSHDITEGNNHQNSSDHWMLEIVRELRKSDILFADITNKAFSQLNMGGKLKKLFESVDETKEFSLGFTYADHALDDIHNDLREMGIFEELDDKSIFKEIQKAEKLDDIREILNNSTIDLKAHIVEEFQNKWMEMRVPADRRRVEEYIRLHQAIREMVSQQLNSAESTMPKEPGSEKRRLF